MGKNSGFYFEQLTAQPSIEFIHPEDQEITLTEMEKLRLGIPLNQFEKRYRCQEGSYKWLAWTAFNRKLLYLIKKQ